MVRIARFASKKVLGVFVLATILALGVANARAVEPHPWLQHFMDDYVRYSYTDKPQPLDRHGNTMSGHTVLLPITGDGSGKPASVDVTLDTDEPFFLPLFYLLGVSYSDGTPNDKMEKISVFTTLDITFKVDGKPVVTRSNVLDHYTGFYLHPPVKVSYPPINGIVWIQAVSYASPALFPPGKHTLTLHLKNTQPFFGSTFTEYNNTFNLTVVKPPHRT